MTEVREIVTPLGVGVHELQKLAQLMGGRLSLRGLIEGSLSGQHRSPKQGVSLDFAQHRDYALGDDLRHLDWRAYAKSDRLVVKQYEEETNLRAFFLLDRSMSMNYQGGGMTTKGTYGARLAAALSWTLLQQGEAVGMVTFGDHVDHYLPASSKRDHFWRLVRTMEERPWLQDTQSAEALLNLPARLPPRGVIFLITDAFDFVNADEDGEVGTPRLVSVAGALRRHGYRVILLHILDPHELAFPFDELSLFEGLEGEDPIKVDPDGVRRAYLEEMKQFCEELERGSRAAGVSYRLCPSDQPLEHAMLGMLERIS